MAVAICHSSCLQRTATELSAIDIGKLGGPIEGLSPSQLKQFYASRNLFQKKFSPADGLGPLYNGQSCFECHGEPGAIGGEGKDIASTGVMRIGRRRKESKLYGKAITKIIDKVTEQDLDNLSELGGPALQRKSITKEFPQGPWGNCQVDVPTISPRAEFVSLRHAGPIFGLGLIDAISPQDIQANAQEERRINPRMAGRASILKDPTTAARLTGKFGWKAQHSTIKSFTADALNTEMGITTPDQPLVKTADGKPLPSCMLPHLPTEPNDKGVLLSRLSFMQTLLAPPGRELVSDAVRRGEKVFEQCQCAFCHKPEMRTADRVYVPNPNSGKELEVKALENKPVRAYSDFLLHNMGSELADGLAQNGATGGEWRTTPLWGLRFKRYYLHDGRTDDLEEAIDFHGGQAQPSRERVERLSGADLSALIAFLRSL